METFYSNQFLHSLRYKSTELGHICSGHKIWSTKGNAKYASTEPECTHNLVFQNKEIFVQLDELDRNTHAWIGFNYNPHTSIENIPV